MAHRSELEELARTSARLLREIVDLHGKLLAQLDPAAEPKLFRRIEALFRRPLTGPRSEALIRYQPIVPGIWTSFQYNCGFIGQLIETPSTDGSGLNVIALELVEPGESRWFTFEIEIPWAEIRPARRCEFTISCRNSKNIECKLSLRAADIYGKHHNLGGTVFRLPDNPAVTTESFELILPHTARFDETKDPKLILFFDVTKFRLDCEYLGVRLE